MLFPHYTLVPWDKRRWPNFSPSEKFLHCKCCGEFYLDVASLDALQRTRTNVGQAIKLNSGHRCILHNARVGGAPRSMHKLIAFDLALKGHDPKKLLIAARDAGFRGFGFYRTFLHVDMGRKRHWITKGGAKTWNGLLY
jgi:hypothetical protein